MNLFYLRDIRFIQNALKNVDKKFMKYVFGFAANDGMDMNNGVAAILKESYKA